MQLKLHHLAVAAVDQVRFRTRALADTQQQHCKPDKWAVAFKHWEPHATDTAVASSTPVDQV